MRTFIHYAYLSVFVIMTACHLSTAWFTPTTTKTIRRQLSKSTLLFQRRKTDDSSSDETTSSIIKKESIRFLGRGENAIVRPGCVLVAPKHEFHHYYRRSVILIHAMGEATDGSGDYLIRGIILDHPTPFTLKEMMEHNPQVVDNPMGENFLFRGGDKGSDGVVLLHTHAAIGRPEIGTSGLFEGGWQEALEMCQSGQENIESSFKAFFNHCEFTEKELEDLLDSVEDGDAWVSLEVPAEFCLNPDFDRGDAWSLLRNAVQQMEIEQ